MNTRYLMIPKSVSAHCCFKATIVDTEKPLFQDNEQMIPLVLDGYQQYEEVCECFDKARAEQITAALNTTIPVPSDDTKRVADYLDAIIGDVMGHGEDPVGFLIASHATLRGRTEKYEAIISGLRQIDRQQALPNFAVVSTSNFDQWWGSLPLNYTSIRDRAEALTVWLAARSVLIQTVLYALDNIDKYYITMPQQVIRETASLRRLVKGAVISVPSETTPFSARELAQEVLKRCRQDIPETVVKSLKVILRRFVETGVYRDEIGELNGEQPTPPLAVQRFAKDASESHERLQRVQARLLAKGVKDVKFTWSVDVSKFPRRTVEDQVADFLEAYLNGECREAEIKDVKE
jgi:hypothetical protein